MTKSKLWLLSQQNFSNSNRSNKELVALGLAFVVIFVSCTASLASAQRLKPDPTCVCDPLCQIYPDELNPNSCGLQIPRSDCPCCRVCAGEAGEPCHPVNQPCDASQGLECHPDSKTCQGKPDCCRLLWRLPGVFCHLQIDAILFWPQSGMTLNVIVSSVAYID